jgi:epsilon-lactone hydrolase
MWMRFLIVVYALAVATLVFVRRLFRGPKRPGWNFTFETGVEIVRRLVRRGESALAAGKALPPLPDPPRSPASSRVRTETGVLAGLPTEFHTALERGDAPLATILYLHGGGYVSCSPATHRELTRRLAIAANARCVVPNYRKAPEHVFPAAVDDAVACYHELLVSGVSSSALFIAGDSAGGGLCLALLQRLRELDAPMPRAALLLSPWVDLACTGETLRSHAEYDYLAADLIAHAAKTYADGESLEHPQISPLHMDFTGIPPLYIQTGGAEVFVSENLALVEKARAAGVQVTHEIAEHMVHVFQAFVIVSRRGQEAIHALGRFVRESMVPSSAAQPSETRPSLVAAPVASETP